MKALLLLFTASACAFPVMADNIRHTGKNIIIASDPNASKEFADGIISAFKKQHSGAKK